MKLIEIKYENVKVGLGKILTKRGVRLRERDIQETYVKYEGFLSIFTDRQNVLPTFMFFIDFHLNISIKSTT